MTTTANPYIAAREDPTRAWTGIVIAEDLEGVVQGIKDGSWIETGLGVAGTGMDALSFVADPFGSLAAWGVGWLIEHVGPLRKALDALAGDPAQITAFAGTWSNVAKGAAAEAARLRAEVEQLSSWVGGAGDAYRNYAGTHIESLGMVSRAAEGLSVGVSLAGMLVGTVRTIVRDLIAQFVGRIAVWAAEVIFSAGIGIGVVAGQVAVAVEAWSVKLAAFLRKLTTSLRRLGELLTRLKAIVGQLGHRAPQLHPPGYIGPERQLPWPSKESRYAARKAAKLEELRARPVREGIERADRELAAGTHKRRFSQEELDWLNADPHRKEIAYDPDIGTYRVSEAQQAFAAEKAGVLRGPLKRAAGAGTDVMDADGVSWSIKGTGPNATVESTVDLVVGDARANRPCLADLRGLSMREQAAIRTLIVDQLAGSAHPEIRFLPPGVERIAGR